MSKPLAERLFDVRDAFASPFVLWATVGIAGGLVAAIGIAFALRKAGVIGEPLYKDVLVRWRSWLWLTALMLGPILLGAGPVMLAVLGLGLLCYREYARMTGLFREKMISAVIVLGILAVNFAVLDHFDRLFFATAVLTCGLVAVVTIPQDRPPGYVQRVALGVMGFMLFGYSFAYVGSIANDENYRAILILILLGVELNDVFAYCVGKAVGGPKLLPATSPGKTVSGSVGALVLTTLLVAGLGHFVFAGTAMARWHLLLILGAMVSALGQLGDLVLSSIKRDVGVKDTGAVIPGHGGLLDRFDSLVLVPPAVYHFLSLHLGPLGGPAQRYFTG